VKLHLPWHVKGRSFLPITFKEAGWFSPCFTFFDEDNIMIKFAKNFTVLVSIFVINANVNAQDFYMPPPIDYSVPVHLMNNTIMTETLANERRNKSSKDYNNSSKKYSDTSNSQFLNGSTTYTPSTARTRTNLQNFANKTRKNDPEGAAKMEQLFASTDIIGQIGSVMQSYAGLDKNNAADAFALYWVSAWKASKGDVSDKSAASYKAVAAQAARGMSQSPEMARATDAQKQEMAEALLVQSALIDGMLAEYGSDPAMMAKLAQSVRQGAKASGLDLDAMTLTEQGFVKADKKRSDASDAAPGAESTALASSGASASPAKTDTIEGSGLLSGAFPGIVIAGLAGSGIAAAFLYGKNKGANKRNG
jgi:hypothetical protein